MSARFEHMQAFVAVAKAKSFSRAAENLYLSQPTISRYISSLEEQVGVRLLIRDKHTNEVILTKAGNQLYQDYAELLQDLSAAEQRARDITNGTAGSLTIHNIPYCWKELYDTLTLFSARYPNVRVRVLGGVVPFEETFENYDIRVMHAFVVAQNSRLLDYMFVKPDPLIALVAEHHPLADRDSISLQQLRQYEIVDSGDVGRPLMMQMHLNMPAESYQTMETAVYEMCRSNAVFLSLESSATFFSPVAKKLRLTGFAGNNREASVGLFFTWKKGITNPVVPLFLATAEEYLRNSIPNWESMGANN